MTDWAVQSVIFRLKTARKLSENSRLIDTVRLTCRIVM